MTAGNGARGKVMQGEAGEGGGAARLLPGAWSLPKWIRKPLKGAEQAKWPGKCYYLKAERKHQSNW